MLPSILCTLLLLKGISPPVEKFSPARQTSEKLKNECPAFIIRSSELHFMQLTWWPGKVVDTASINRSSVNVQ